MNEICLGEACFARTISSWQAVKRFETRMPDLLARALLVRWTHLLRRAKRFHGDPYIFSVFCAAPRSDVNLFLARRFARARKRSRSIPIV
jgi:hypothetical protein